MSSGPLLPAAVICDLAGVSQSKYVKWVSQRVVRPASGSGCSLLDCLELAVAQALVVHLKRLEALRITMNQLVEGLPDIPEIGTLDVLYEPRYSTALWGYSPNDLAEFGRHYHRILVVDMRQVVDDVRRGFARRVQDRASRPLRIVGSKPA